MKKVKQPVTNISLGAMLAFWNDRGTFNEQLYLMIVKLRQSQS